MLGLIVLAVVLASLYFYWSSQNRADLERCRLALHAKRLPGPTGLPVIGCLHKVSNPTCKYLTRQAKLHGPVYQMRVGVKDYVILNEYGTLKRAFIDQAPLFSERFHSKFHDLIVRKSGIAIQDYSKIGEHKKFLLRSLREYGFGPTAPQGAALIELEYIRGWIGQQADTGTPSNPITPLRKVFSNMISAIAFDQRLGAEDEDFERQITAITAFMEAENIIKNPLNFYPFLNQLLFLFIRIPFFRKSLTQWDQVHEYIEAKLLVHQADMRRRGVIAAMNESASVAVAEESEGHVKSRGAPPESFLDLYLLELERTTEKARHTGCQPDFTFADVREVMLELFFAGTDTSSLTLMWTFWLMSLFPEVQRRAHDEILRVIGTDRPPYNSDKTQLHYCMAVIDEILRVSSLTPLGIMHRCKEDTVVDGYFVAKDSLVVSNFYAIHRDPSVWARPEEFRPEHFLDEKTGEYRAHPEMLAFSLGKRVCLGKGLARLDLYIMFVGIFQKFRVSLPHADSLIKGRKLTTTVLDDIVVRPRIDGMMRSPSETKFVFERLTN